MERIRRWAPDVVAVILVVVGALHFVAPSTFAATVPRWVRAPRAAVLVSGVVEVGVGVALLRRVRWAGPVAAAVLLAIWPANIQMALDAGSGRNPGLGDNPVAMWARVPLQLPMVWAVLQARRRRQAG